MKQNDLISVVVPIFNVSEYLRRCIESILEQTYKNLQIILVDDGSTDNCGTICDEYSRIDNRILVIHKSNGGLVSARKEGLSKAKGKYIGFVDGDDYINPDMYDKLYCEIIQTNSDFVHSTYWIDLNGELKAGPSITKETIIVDGIDSRNRLMQRYLYEPIGNDGFVISSIWSKLFLADFIKMCYRFVPDEQSYGEDLLCWFVCLKKSNRIRVINEMHYNYVIRDDSMSHIDGIQLFYKEMGLSNSLVELNKKIAGYEDRDFYRWIRWRTIRVLARTSEVDVRSMIPHFYLRDTDVLENKRVVIYGGGAIGYGYARQLYKEKKCNIVAILDKQWEDIIYGKIKVLAPDSIQDLDFDYVLIALKDICTADDVCDYLEELGVPKEKILWDRPGW